MQKIEFIVEKDGELIKAVIDKLPFLSRFDVKKILDNKDIRINGVRTNENIEIKKGKPDVNALKRQIARYAAFDEISAMVVLTQRAVSLPRSVLGKPVHSDEKNEKTLRVGIYRTEKRLFP